MSTKNFSEIDEKLFVRVSGMQSGHTSYALHDQIFRDCMMNFCTMRYKFFNLMRNGTSLE